MNTLANIILESHLGTRMQNLLYEACCILEATNINKDYLLHVAGSPEKLADAKNKVNEAWANASLANIIPAKLNQKVLNFTYLMELLQPGFVDAEYIAQIHDLAIQRSLEQRFINKVNSDTVPEQAKAILYSANADAVQATKAYPGLTPEQERIWNRVKVYHEFPDGFRWVYAVDDNGCKIGYMPSSITSITMHHCGNEPSNQSGNEYWELRDARGKAYLTIILNDDGGIEESKSWGNQLNKYTDMILPHVKWLLKDRQVTGVGDRYNAGYAPHMNFGVKDFIGKDDEFVDYVVENKPQLIGKAEARVLFLKGAIDSGVLSVQDLKNAYSEGMTIDDLKEMVPALSEYEEKARFKLPDNEKGCSSSSIFGYNSYAVLCAACGGNPFTKEELISLILAGKISLEVFASYDVHLLTDDIQVAFIKANATHNFNVLQEIASQVANFRIAPSIIDVLLPDGSGDADKKDVGNRLSALFTYLETAKPPSKVYKYAERLFSSETCIGVLDDVIRSESSDYGWTLDAVSCLKRCINILRLHDIPNRVAIANHLANTFSSVDLESHDIHSSELLEMIASFDSIDNDDLILGVGRGLSPDVLVASLNGLRDSTDYDVIQHLIRTIERMKGLEFLQQPEIVENIRDFRVSWALVNMHPDIDNDDGIATHTATRCCAIITSNGRSDDLKGSARIILLQAMGKFPSIIPAVYEEDKDDFMSAINDVMSKEHSKEIKLAGLTEAMVETIIDAIAGIFDINVDQERSWGYESDRELGCYDWERLGKSLCYMARLYSIRPKVLCAKCQERLPAMIEHKCNVPGAWDFCEVPFEQWEAAFRQWGYKFLRYYVLLMPDDQFNESKFISDFVVNKLADADKANGDIVDAIERMRSGIGPGKMSRIAKIISYKIVNNELPMDEQRFNALYRLRMINSDAYRAYMSRVREATGSDITISSIEDAENTDRMIKSMTKYDRMPDIVSTTVKYLLDNIYEHLGDGRHTWRVDEEASGYVDVLDSIMGKILSKYKTGMVPYTIKRLFDDGSFARIDGFKKANWDACKTPGKPLAKLRCDADGIMEEIAGQMNGVRDTVEEIAAKPIKKPGAKKRAAKATPAPN
jgi:hypothetical protein